MNKFLLPVLFLISAKAFALQSVPMIDVVAEAEPSSVGYINLNVQDDSTFDSLNFTDKVKENKTISIADLNKKKVAILSKGPVNIVSVSAKSLTNNSMLVNVHYLNEYKLIGSKYKIKQVKVYYVAPSNLYETMDVDTNKVITHAYAYSNIIGGQIRGISRIETW